jgi:glycosyltransferase involved in cell wall biosynthesis
MQGSEKIVYVKLQEPETYRENGRHIFAVLNAFTTENYQVYLSGDVKRRLEGIFGQSTSDWPPPARLAISLPYLKVVDSLPSDIENGIYIFDKEDKGLKARPWRKKLRIKFDLFSPYRFSTPVLLPYNVHPMHANRVVGESLSMLRATNRNVRILFAGDLEGYKRRWISYPKQKLSRIDVISTIKERLGDHLRLAKTPDELNEVMNSEYTRELVIVDNDGARVPWDQWMDVIARADFFLCPPGIVMPMCHNIIEAMAIGTIPITNYPEWFSPKLEHMKNCIVFDGQDDLIEKINLALAMNDDQKNELRENAMKYYETYLRPDNFVRKVEARGERKLNVLMYSEYNVARKKTKLNGRSALMRGEHAVGNWAWLARAWQS